MEEVPLFAVVVYTAKTCLTSKLDMDAETELNNSVLQGHISAEVYFL